MRRSVYEGETVGKHLRTDTIVLSGNDTVSDAISIIRKGNISDQITYFYVTNTEGTLIGVLPIRKVLSAEANDLLSAAMIRSVVTLKESDSCLKAEQLFAAHKYLSLPVVDISGRFLGVFDITYFTGKRLDFSENHRFDDVFETVGVRTSMLRYLTPLSAFRHRFPWLMPTLLSGLTCALLTSFFEATLSESIILAFFMTLILGLGESVSIQTLTITIRQLHLRKPSLRWYLDALRRELFTAFFLGAGVAILLEGIIVLWKKDIAAGLSIGVSIICSLLTASFFGVSIPALLHKTKLDPKVAAGPLVLGLSDLCTLLFYFSFAKMILER